MSKKNSTVDINGQRYVARTGQLVGGEQGSLQRSVGNIDGIIATPGMQSRPLPIATPEPPRRTPVVRHVSHHPQSPKTLMRHTVKKPALAPTRLKARGQAVATTSALRVERSADPKRLQKASTIGRSQSISRFGSPASSATSGMAPSLAQPTVTIARQTPSKPIVSMPDRARTSADLLERALHHANSHEHFTPNKKSFGLTKRLSSISLVVIVGVALLGLVVSQNLATIKIQVASAKAGFNASLPGYSPSGFRVAGLDYSPGSVAIHYLSNSDERAYTITEKNSAWDSETLRDMFVAKTTQNYQTIEAGGRTIYLYGNSQATWVNAGVWYQVQTGSSLSDRQLVSLATSL